MQAFSFSYYKNNFNLVISGNADNFILNYLKILKIEKSVIFLGDHLSDAYLAELYRGAFATVMPSLYEGFGLPALESMACGTPVIASNAAALPEVIGNGGVFFNPYDCHELAYTMDKLIEDNKTYQQCAQNGIIRSHDFSWDKTTQLIQETFQSKDLY